jgi:organic hydroperoxide reductase OsmC/OhrA
MAAEREHTYRLQVVWSGNLGQGTSGYKVYERAHEITGAGKPVILGSSDPAFRGDSARYNPEEFLVGSLSACHMLSYLHLCAEAGVVVVGYQDHPVGVMVEIASGSGRFKAVTLKPVVRLAPGSDAAKASALHERAHAMCFIANSVNFPVGCEPVIEVGNEVVAWPAQSSAKSQGTA